ncbi:hypothetical protein KJ359_001387 [Pestalotiopsis sp. 9143b]|nr:hypothetical protein KJ359_001387 [Pestalotiopsis sp. 9143b]
MSEPMVTTHARPTPQLLSLLCAHLPDSLPLLRRLQFAAGNPAGTTEHSRVLFSGSSPEDHDAVFAAAYVDVSRGPETEAWVYSSLEGRKTGGEDEDEADRCVLALLRAVRALRDEYDASNPERERQKPTVLFGTLGDAVRLRLLNLGVVSTYVTVWDKWVFRLAGLPGGAVAAAERHMAAGGMGWGAVESGEDARRTLLSLPSTAIKLGDGTPVAWAFLSCDGSLASLHCEEPYRGRGFAKAVAVKLMQDHLGDFGDDGYCAADVAPENAQSQGVCRSLGGKVAWTVTW